jgi:hypothetical protein
MMSSVRAIRSPENSKSALERKILARAIIADRQDPKAATVPKTVVHKVKRPAIVGNERLGFDRSASQRELAANSLADLQIRRSIDPGDALVLVEDALSSEQHRQPWKPVPTMFSRDRDESNPHGFVVASRTIVHELAIDAQPMASGSLFGSEPLAHGLHRCSSLCRPQKFPSATMLSASMLSA